jgi:CheY-like chemotaxis protein
VKNLVRTGLKSGDESATKLAEALHEVSNALTAALGWLKQAKSEVPPGPGREALEVAYAQARLGYAVARRAVGAPVSGVEEIRSAATLAQEALKGVEPMAYQKALELCFVGDDNDVLVHEATTAHQILLNLLLNAVAFSPAHGRVELELLRDGRFVRFVVRDEGPGVPPERRGGLFDGGGSTRPGGSGIGLRHSRQLALSKGGNLALLDSERGAVFELRFPMGEALSSALHITPGELSLSDLRVLVLEDDQALMSLLEFGFSSHGVTLVPVRTFEDFCRELEEGPAPDAALVDLSPIASRPDDALVLLETLEGRLPPLVVMSGGQPASDGGPTVSEWLRKPFELSDVFEVLRRVTRRPDHLT